MLKPPISRMGGKSKLRKTIIEMIPEHKCYKEVQVNYSVCREKEGRGKYKELIITNY